jgi:hypothetical protein
MCDKMQACPRVVKGQPRESRHCKIEFKVCNMSLDSILKVTFFTYLKIWLFPECNHCQSTQDGKGNSSFPLFQNVNVMNDNTVC